MASLRRNLKPWLATPAAQFTKADLRAARDGADRTPASIAANRFLAYFGPLMKWAAQEDMVPHNFVPDIRRAPESKRTRKLTDAEIRAIWKACDNLGSREAARNYGRLVKFLLVRAQRRDEARACATATSSTAVEAIAEQSGSAAHPCAAAAGAIADRAGDGAGIVFAGRSGKLSGYSKMKAELDEVSGVKGWVLHDLRRSAASRMQGLGIPRPHRAGSAQPRGARCRRRLSAGRTGKAKGRGVAGVGGGAGEDRAADVAGGVMSHKDDVWVLGDNLDQPKRHGGPGRG